MSNLSEEGPSRRWVPVHPGSDAFNSTRKDLVQYLGATFSLSTNDKGQTKTTVHVEEHEGRLVSK